MKIPTHGVILWYSVISLIRKGDTKMEVNIEDTFHPLLKLHAYDYLMQLRELGFNMFGVRQDLIYEFDLDKQQATKLLTLFHSGELESNHRKFHRGESTK